MFFVIVMIVLVIILVAGASAVLRKEGNILSYLQIVIGVVGILVTIWYGSGKKDPTEAADQNPYSDVEETKFGIESGGYTPEWTDEGSDTKEIPDDTDDDIIIDNISLIDLEPYKFESRSSNGPFGKEYGIKDIFGNQYSTAIVAYMSREDGVHSETYRINGKYKTFRFTIAIPEGSKGSKYSGSVIIKTDNKKVFELGTLTADTESKEYTISLSGVEDLTIEMYGDHNMAPGGISIIMCNPTLEVE